MRYDVVISGGEPAGLGTTKRNWSVTNVVRPYTYCDVTRFLALTFQRTQSQLHRSALL